MSGTVPTRFVTCTNCKGPRGLIHCGICRSCMGKMYRGGHQWQPEQDAALRNAYSLKTRPEISRKLTELCRQWKLTRATLTHRAQALGVAKFWRKYWTPQEYEFIRANAGRLSAYQIARELHRSIESVKVQMHRMKISRVITEGFTQEQVAQLFGVAEQQVQRWMSRGWLRWNQHRRITEQDLRDFVFLHPDKYSLRRVQEHWFKELIFRGGAWMTTKIEAMKCPRCSWRPTEDELPSAAAKHPRGARRYPQHHPWRASLMPENSPTSSPPTREAVAGPNPTPRGVTAESRMPPASRLSAERRSA